jgi:hypothetical protein
MNEDIQKLGRRIKQLRIEKGYPTPEAFAAKHGIDTHLYKTYEAGTDMPVTAIHHLATAFGITMHEFVEGM